MKEHPEDFCDKCKRPNIVWYADNDLWNAVVGDDWSILCPICFVKLAEEKGISCTSWRVSREDDDLLVNRLKKELSALKKLLPPEEADKVRLQHCF